jgi:hypothetical protein
MSTQFRRVGKKEFKTSLGHTVTVCLKKRKEVGWLFLTFSKSL